jgi:hypothetical protein
MKHSGIEFWKMKVRYLHLHCKGFESTSFHINTNTIPALFVILFKVYNVKPGIVTLRFSFIRMY